MEPFVDFGLIELLAASGLAWLARRVYSRRALAVAFLILSIAAPAALVMLAGEGRRRWLAALCLVTALVNAAALFVVMRRGEFPLAQPEGSRGR